jgi:hypothetical protein
MSHAARQHALRDARIAQGLCGYGNHPADPGMRSCAACRAKRQSAKGTGTQQGARRPARTPVVTKPRNCLRCERTFDSWGAANALCSRCRVAAVDSGPESRRLPRLFKEVIGGW